MNRRNFLVAAGLVGLGVEPAQGRKRKRKRVKDQAADGNGIHWNHDYVSIRVVGSLDLMHATIEAVNRWKPNNAPILSVAVGGQGPVTVGEIKIWEEVLPGDTLGECWRDVNDRGIIRRATIAVDPWSWNVTDQMVRVIAHELGHAYGLGHSREPGSIMDANSIDISHPSPGDIARLNSRY